MGKGFTEGCQTYRALIRAHPSTWNESDEGEHANLSKEVGAFALRTTNRQTTTSKDDTHPRYQTCYQGRRILDRFL
jgi:hypothetical protein